MANLPRLLARACCDSPAYGSLVRAASREGRTLTAILYNDEAQAGNVLGPLKVLKASLVYVSFVEFGSAVLRREDAWLAVAMATHAQLERAAGGLSAFMREAVKELLSSEAVAGFAVSVGAEVVHLKLGPEAFFLADNDAIRATKGSAGTRCCTLCTNALRGPTSVPGFFGCEEGDVRKFSLTTDADVGEAVRALQHEAQHGSKASLQRLEKALGLACTPDGLLFDAEASARMPISKVCNDIMHCYYSNGCANWELQRLLCALGKVGLPLEDLAAVCKAAPWKGPAVSQHNSKSYMASLWSAKLFGEETYKGSAQQTQSFLPLLNYYVHELLGNRCDLMVKERASFTALIGCHRLLRHVCRSAQAPSQDWKLQLERQQWVHQELFKEAYGVSACKPKHHHRLHLPSQLVHLACAIHTETHESKHRSFKNRLASAHIGDVNRPVPFASALLTRMFLEQLSRVERKTTLATNVLQGQIAQHAERPNCQSASGMCLESITVRVSDMVLVETVPGVVQECLKDDEGFLLVLQVLQKLQSKPWGGLLLATAESRCFRVSSSTNVTMPSWWRTEGSSVTWLF